MSSTIRRATVWKRSWSRGGMYSWWPAGFKGKHVPVARFVNCWLGSVVWVGAWPHGYRTNSLYEWTSRNTSIRYVSHRYLTFFDSGSENAAGPTKVSAHGLHDALLVVTPQTMSRLRLTSTPSHGVPGLSRRFFRHRSSLFRTYSRPSGLAHGSIQMSSVSIINLISSADHARPPSARPVPFK